MAEFDLVVRNAKIVKRRPSDRGETSPSRTALNRRHRSRPSRARGTREIDGRRQVSCCRAGIDSHAHIEQKSGFGHHVRR